MKKGSVGHLYLFFFFVPRRTFFNAEELIHVKKLRIDGFVSVSNVELYTFHNSPVICIPIRCMQNDLK